jgi:hypothetical protein
VEGNINGVNDEHPPVPLKRNAKEYVHRGGNQNKEARDRVEKFKYFSAECFFFI